MSQGKKSTWRSVGTFSGSSSPLSGRLPAVPSGDRSDPFAHLGMQRDADGENNADKMGTVQSKNRLAHGMTNSLLLTLPLGTAVLKPERTSR
ncbi:MAG: hypothetical protein ACLQUZ_04020 [Rhizomicrobium sp.]